MTILRDIFATITNLTKEPDPLRFANTAAAQPLPGWNGVKVRQGRGVGERVVLENAETNTWAFPDASNFDTSQIKPFLTDGERAELKGKGYNPDNPAYSNAKRYFHAQRGVCTKEQLAANSGGNGVAKLSAETCKDVLAAFNRHLNDK